ncbi:peptidase M66 family protein, partial [Vibrio parahaemolyticus AQ3810]
RHHGQHRGK